MKSALGIAFLAATIPLIVGSTAHAEEKHSFNITNNSSVTMKLNQIQSMCVSGYSGYGDIPPHTTITINWTDRNSFGDDCTNREKFIAVWYDRGDWQGWLGMVHRKISGDWYNGQFYAYHLHVGSYTDYTFGDNPPPPGTISALCSHNNDCFGPFSEMVDDNKTNFNWQRVYKTEDGWEFRYDDFSGE
ncbi:hypothetical protein [Inquilinus sp.]|jgi:hypothetical protein|uniref:hypothetical protein n=1 Tax=Inquilinus sp. TaxID=1932117 RepID=UPI00378300FF